MKPEIRLRTRRFGAAIALSLAAALIASAELSESSSAAASTSQEGADSASAPATDAPSTGESSDEILRIAVASDFDLLDPHKAALETFLVFFPMVYDSLLAVDKNGEPAPGLAESWDISEDGLTYTFHLRDDVTFHSGRQFTSADVKWNIERMINPETGSIRAIYFKNVASIDTPDDFTVVLNMTQRDAAILAWLATQGGTSMIDKDDVNAEGNVVNHVGTGPFIWTEYKPGELTATRNDNYWGGAPRIGGIQLQVIADPQARLQALESGQIDYAYTLPPVEANAAAESGAFTIVENPSNRANSFVFNTTRPPFDNPEVRDALCRAFSRQDIIDAAWNGYAVQTEQFFYEDSFWHVDIEPSVPVDGDFEGAKAALEAAGVTEFSGVLIDSIAEPEMALETQIGASTWAELGFDLEIQQVDTPTFVEQVRGGNYDVAHMFLGFIPDPGRPFELMHSTSTGNAYFGFAISPESDALIEAVRNESDPELRREAVAEVVNYYVEARGTCLTVRPLAFVGIGNRVQNFEQGAIYLKYNGEGSILDLTLA